jgi:glycerol-3-phosphate acyltransferase PlsY
VVAIDIGKGTLATGLIPALGLALPGQPFSTEAQMLAYGFAAVIGHCFPIWYGFRGGKGAATAVGVLAVIQPLILAPMLLTWLLVLVLTGWVGLATMVAACSLIPLFFWLGVSPAMQWFALALAAFIVLMHRSNIAKMIRRTEHRFQRVRIVNWFR